MSLASFRAYNDSGKAVTLVMPQGSELCYGSLRFTANYPPMPTPLSTRPNGGRGSIRPGRRLLVDYHSVKVAVVLSDWLKKLLGRSGSVSPAEEGRVEHQIDSDSVDRYAGRVMGVYGDIGPTVPSPESPPDRPVTD